MIVCRMGKNVKMSLSKKLTKYIQENDDGELSDLLDDASRNDAKIISRSLPILLEHPSWVLRASALDYVGYCELVEFLPQVKKSLKDQIINVRMYALGAYYDLLKKKAMPVLKRESKSPVSKLKVNALSLLFIETQDMAVLGKISDIIKRKNCRQDNQFVVYNNFDYYLEIESFPEIIEIFRYIKESSPNIGMVRTLEIDKRI